MEKKEKYIKLVNDVNTISKNTESDLIHSAIDLRKNIEEFTDYVIDDFGISIDTSKFHSVTLDVKIKAIQSELLSKKEVNTLYRIKKIGNQAAHGNTETASKLNEENIKAAIRDYSELLNNFIKNVDNKIKEYNDKNIEKIPFEKATNLIERCLNLYFDNQLDNVEHQIEFKQLLYSSLEEYLFELCQKYKVKVSDPSIYAMNRLLKQQGYLPVNVPLDIYHKIRLYKYIDNINVRDDYPTTCYEIFEKIRLDNQGAFSGELTFDWLQVLDAVVLYNIIYNTTQNFTEKEMNLIPCISKAIKKEDCIKKEEEKKLEWEFSEEGMKKHDEEVAKILAEMHAGEKERHRAETFSKIRKGLGNSMVFVIEIVAIGFGIYFILYFFLMLIA